MGTVQRERPDEKASRVSAQLRQIAGKPDENVLTLPTDLRVFTYDHRLQDLRILVHLELSGEVLETRVSESELSVDWIEVVKTVADLVDGQGFSLAQ